MRFPYRPLSMRQPVYSLGGSRTRYYPIIPVLLTGPKGRWMRDCLLDSGADDTLFPDSAAAALGIDLSGAPTATALQIGGTAIPYTYASVSLRIADGSESCEWVAVVGFTNKPLRWPLLGQTGVFPFFDVTLFGARREIGLTPNASFSGRHTIH
jgi:hypothetical protein